MNTNYCAYVDKGLRLTFKSDQNNQLATNVRPCCMTHREKIPRKDYRYAKVDAQSILEHPTRVHFQNWFKENTSHLHPACNVCTNLEKAMSPSPRTEMNSIAKNHTDFDILRLDVDLSNKCNLACVFCNSHASSLIETVSAKYQKEELPEHWRTHTDKQPKNADITNLLADILRNYKVKSIHIKGGEPLLVENWKPIEKVLDEIDCSELELEITTNGTVMNDEIIQRLSKTKRSRIKISVDGIHKNYEFLRWPHSWKKMEKNLDFIFSHQSEVLNVDIGLLVNLYNFEYLPQIEELFNNKKWKYYMSFDIKPDNSVLNCMNLPTWIIHKVYGQLQNPHSWSMQGIGTVLDKLKENNNKRDLSDIAHDTKFYLAQRQMKAVDVIGPLTLGYLESI
jgi:sulfatase maturation enzyme AslB (radical SAM superfamily)